MELQILIEEQRTIKEKISDSLVKLKEWFKSKINEVKVFFKEFSAKIKAKNLNKFKGRKLKKDIIENGQVKFKKGTNTDKVIAELNNELNMTKKEFNEALNHCYEGIRYIDRRQQQPALDRKKSTAEKIEAGLKRTSTIIKYTQAIVLSVIAINVAVDKEKERIAQRRVEREKERKLKE